MANVSTLKRGGTLPVGVNTNQVDIIRHEIDIAKAVTAGLTTGAYVVVQTMPAHTRLKIWGLRNATALSLGSGPRLDLGDGDDDDLYVSNATAVTVDTDHALTGDTAISSTARVEKTFGTAGELRLKITGGTLASGVVEVIYSVIDMNRRAPATT